MSFTIGWSDGEAIVSTPAEAEGVLDRVAASGAVYLMTIAPDDGRESLVELVWGDSERAMLMYADPFGSGWAVETGVPPATDDLGYDYGAIEPDRTRLSAGTARILIARYVATGTRPTGVSWMQ